MEKEKLIGFLKSKEMQRLPYEFWDSLTWTIMHTDVIKKITACSACDKKDFVSIQQLLYNEKRYDLFLTALFLTNEIRNIDLFPEVTTSNCDQALNIKLIHGQLLTFEKWCDSKDKSILKGNDCPYDALRLVYICCYIGYNELAFFILNKLSSHDLEYAGEIMKRQHVKRDLLFRKWVYDFYKKQENANLKKHLAKRIIVYGKIFLSFEI